MVFHSLELGSRSENLPGLQKCASFDKDSSGTSSNLMGAGGGGAVVFLTADHYGGCIFLLRQRIIAAGVGARAAQAFRKWTHRFSLNRRKAACSKPGLPRPHAQRIEPVLNTFAPAGDVK